MMKVSVLAYLPLLFLSSALMLIVLFFANTKVVNAAFDPLEKPCSSVSGSDVCDDSANPGDPLNGQDGIFTKTVNILSYLAGVIAVIIVVVAGITMMTSQGDPGKLNSSRDAIIYAGIGIAVIVLARTIVIFVYNRI